MSKYKAMTFDNLERKLCDYGCNQIARYKFKNGKICCSIHIDHCENHRKRLSVIKTGKTTKKKGIHLTKELIKKMLDSKKQSRWPLKLEKNENILCSYGCGKLAIYEFSNGKYCCSKTMFSCLEIIKKSKKTKNSSCKLINNIEFLCEYGCNKLAKYQFSNGKYCCESKYVKCDGQRLKNKNSNLKGKISEPFDNINSELCDYGCNQIARYKFKNGKVCCSKLDNYCPEKNKRISKSNTGKIRTEEFKKIMSKSKKGKSSGMLGKKQTLYCKQFNSERLKNGEAKRLSSFPRNPEKIKKLRENNREKMLNGKAKYMHTFPCMGFSSQTEWMKNDRGRYIRSFIKKISKDEKKLRELVKNLYSGCIFQFQILNYDVDIALVNHKIAIEFDGYYHFDTKEHKSYHTMRQEQIENEGWKFYRVTMFDKFPTLEEVKEKIENLIKERNETAN